jgi:hypothetical protein
VASFAGPGFCAAGTGFMSGKLTQVTGSIKSGNKMPAPLE